MATPVRSEAARGARLAVPGVSLKVLGQLRQLEDRLERDDSGGAPHDAPFDLVPAIASTYGGWHPDFAAWLRGAARGAAEFQGAGVLFRAAASSAVALQCGNFGVLAAASPALAARAGRLARPLGEEPEAWRAAPDAAVQVADDVGLPEERAPGEPAGQGWCEQEEGQPLVPAQQRSVPAPALRRSPCVRKCGPSSYAIFVIGRAEAVSSVVAAGEL